MSKVSKVRKSLLFGSFIIAIAFENSFAQVSSDIIQEEINKYQRVVQLNSHSIQAHCELAIIYTKYGFNREAVETFVKTIRLKTNYFNIGGILDGEFDRPGVMEKASNIYNNLGLAFLELDLYREIIWTNWRIDDIQSEYFPDSSKKYFDLSIALEKQNRDEEARNAFEKAIKIEQEIKENQISDSAKKYCDLCSVYYQQNLFEEAIKACKKALFFKLDCAAAYLKLAEVYSKLDCEDVALEICLSAKGLKKNPAEALLTLGKVYGNLGKYTEERSAYMEAVAYEPHPAEVNYRLALVYLTDGEIKKAKEQFDILKLADKDLAEKLSTLLDK